MNNIFLLILSFIIIGVLFILLFLDIGCKAYDYFMTIKAKKMLKKGWRCCSLCSNEKCLFRGNKTGDGCYGEYECLRYMEYSDLNKDSEVKPMSEKMYPYPKKMHPTKEDILYNIEEGIISKAVGEELIKQIESLPEESNPKIQVPRGQSKGFAGLKCRYEFGVIEVGEDDIELQGGGNNV